MKIRVFLLGFGYILWPLKGLTELVWTNDDQRLGPEIPSRQVAAHFQFKNTGSKEVKITAVKSSCGCVTAALPKTVYQPGESGEVVATFAYGERVGEQEKAIMVQTDDPDQPAKVLTFRVNIPQILEITPSFLFWRVGEAPAAKRMSVKVAKGADVGELTATCSTPDFDVRIEKGTADGGQNLVVTPKDTKQQETAFIRLETGGKEPKSFVAHLRIK